MKKLISHALLYSIFLFGAHPLFAGDHSVSTFFIINSPSAESRGPDSILTFDSRGKSTVFFGAEHNLTGLRDIVCNPKKPQHIIVSRSDANAAGFLIFNASGRIIHTLPSGSGNIALAFDHTGNLYVAEANVTSNVTIFKNDISFANLPLTGIGQLAVDSRGNLYLTDPFISPRVFRIDQVGNVTVFADAAQGLDGPFGLAVDSRDNIFVANNARSGSTSILKFDPSGTVTPFAPDIVQFSAVRGMTFDHDDNLYATISEFDRILKFDKTGNSSVFADAKDGLNFPAAITVGTCPVKKKDKGEQEEE